MNYELAIQLKEAGFPQGGNQSLHIDIAFPTLSELIEACPKECLDDKTYTLCLEWNFQGHWLAGYRWHEDDIMRESGLTPEEAVAKLWLELNKNVSK